MPARSKAQQRLMGMALEAKRTGRGPAMAQQMAAHMTEKQLSEFAGTPRKGLPRRVARPAKGGRR